MIFPSLYCRNSSHWEIVNVSETVFDYLDQFGTENNGYQISVPFLDRGERSDNHSDQSQTPITRIDGSVKLPGSNGMMHFYANFADDNLFGF